MISLEDQSASITVQLGEKVTVRVEESSGNGLLWSSPFIDGDGLSLRTSRSLIDDDSDIEYREFVFETHCSGRNVVSASLKQAGIEEGVKQLFMVVEITDARESEGSGC